MFRLKAETTEFPIEVGGDGRQEKQEPLKRWLVRIVWAAVLIFGTVVIGGAVSARRRLPDLESWHRYVPADATASDLETATLADYLRREDTVFRDVRDRIERTSRRIGAAAGQPLRPPQPIVIPRASVGTVTAPTSSCPRARLSAARC